MLDVIASLDWKEWSLAVVALLIAVKKILELIPGDQGEGIIGKVLAVLKKIT